MDDRSSCHDQCHHDPVHAVVAHSSFPPEPARGKDTELETIGCASAFLHCRVGVLPKAIKTLAKAWETRSPPRWTAAAWFNEPHPMHWLNEDTQEAQALVPRL
jgi:hypothetical protein